MELIQYFRRLEREALENCNNATVESYITEQKARARIFNELKNLAIDGKIPTE